MGTPTIIAVSFAVALVSGWVVLRRQGVLLLGRLGPTLAPAFLFALWLLGLLVGEMFGSLSAMAVAAAVPLVILGALSWPRKPLRRHGIARWSPIDFAVLAFVATVVLLVDRHDIECHRAVVGNYLRGNIPPTALNDPDYPLGYHPLYNSVVALLVRTLPIDLELGLDLVSILCVSITMFNLVVISRMLFRTRVAAVVGRTLFVLGFGPTYVLGALRGWDWKVLHGTTAQAYVEIILRRPTALSFVLYTLCLLVLLPYYRRERESPLALKTPHPALMLPIAALLPQASEELVLLVAVLVFPLVVWRRISLRWVVPGVLVLLVGMFRSGVVWGVLGFTSTASPKLTVGWPLTLPNWNHHTNGIPIFSNETLQFLGFELGPVFLATVALVLLRGGPRKKILLLPFLVGLAFVSLVQVKGWPKSDLDRFLFVGTTTVFLLCASWIDFLFPPSQRGARATRGRRFLGLGLTAVMVTAPIVYMSSLATLHPRGPLERFPHGEELRQQLAVVGPREAIVTTVERANELVQAGFIVVGPMTSNIVGAIADKELDAYVREHFHRATWLFLPENTPGHENLPVHAKHKGYVLLRIMKQG